MQTFFISLMECSVTMSVLVLCLIGLTSRLSKKYDAKWLYYIWLVIVIGLIIPFRFHTETPMIHKTLFVNPVTAKQMEYDAWDMMENDQSQTEMQNTMVGDPGNQESGIIELIQHSSWYRYAGALWIFGVAVFISLHVMRHKCFIQMVRRWSKDIGDKYELDILQNQKSKLGISKQVALCACPCISSPMMIGMINPMILIPSKHYSESELSLFFRHELVHLKRKDLWYKALVFIAIAIHWFNPIIYLMARAIAVQCEISCDMEVVKNTEINKRQFYSETILSVVKNSRIMQIAFSTNFYGGKKEMKNRIISIMDVTKKKSGIFILFAIIILTAGSGAVFASSSYYTEDLKPLTEETGAITIYYHPFHTLEENVRKTLGEDVPEYTETIGGVMPHLSNKGPASAIDISGRKTPSAKNRTKPHYAVSWDWMAKNSEAGSYVQKILSIKGTEVTLAFTDETQSYIGDDVIEKMITNLISFASIYKDETFDYDYEAFIGELADRGIIVIHKVTTPQSFGWCVTNTANTGFWATKMLTDFDTKEKITSIYNGDIIVPVVNLTSNTDGNVGLQVGDSFIIREGETLAIDIKDASDNMPKINWSIVNLDTGKTVKWMPNTLSGYRFVWTPSDKYVNNTFSVKVSTCEPHNISDKAVLEIFTYKTGQQEVPSVSD